MQEFLATGESWNRATWGGSEVFFTQAVGCVRSVFARSKLKIQFLDDLPYVLARLGVERGIGPKAIQQYDSASRQHHNKTSIEVCDPDSPLRAEIVNMVDDFTLSPILKQTIERIQKTNINDKYGEGPHAMFKPIQLAAHRSSFPWVASTVRLDQNLKDAHELPLAIGCSWQECWDTYKNIIQTDRHRFRNHRCNRKVFLERVYNCSHMFVKEEDSSEEEDLIDSRFE